MLRAHAGPLALVGRPTATGWKAIEAGETATTRRWKSGVGIVSATSGLIVQSARQDGELHLHRGLLRLQLLDLRILLGQAFLKLLGFFEDPSAAAASSDAPSSAG